MRVPGEGGVVGAEIVEGQVKQQEGRELACFRVQEGFGGRSLMALRSGGGIFRNSSEGCPYVVVQVRSSFVC